MMTADPLKLCAGLAKVTSWDMFLALDELNRSDGNMQNTVGTTGVQEVMQLHLL